MSSPRPVPSPGPGSGPATEPIEPATPRPASVAATGEEGTPRSSKRNRSRASSMEPPATPSTRKSLRNTPQKGSVSKKRSKAGRGGSIAGSELDVIPPSPGATPSEADLAITSPLPTTLPVFSEIDFSSPLNYGTPGSVVPGTPASTVRGTPVRHRSDIRNERRMRQVNLGVSETDQSRSDSRGVATSESGAGAGSGAQLVIWGTDVVVSRCKEKFKRFVNRFKMCEVESDERIEGVDPEKAFYLQKLEEVFTLEEPFLNVNCNHLKMFDVDLYQQLVCYPQEVIPTLDMAVNEMFFENYPDAQLQHQIQVRPFNADKTKNLRGLNPEDVDQLITIAGMVIRTSNIIPEMCESFFRCNVCSGTTSVEIDRGRISEPTICNLCNVNYSYSLIHNRSRFSDKQMVKLQESPDDMPAGETPHTVILFAHNDLVDAVQPGDRVTITGIFRATALRVNTHQRNVKAVYRTHIDVIHFRKVDSKRLHEDLEDGKECRFTPERIEKLRNLAKVPDIYERLANAIAPSIYENEDIKKGILLQLFGGTRKDFTNTGRGNFRSEVNILLCGDPGTSKSQLLQYVHNLVPRGQYTSGKGSSAVGLTAYVTRDPETRQLILQTGALVLSDNGICCIDEFDKMSDSTRSVLHEVMEQQTLSIAKAGIICQLNARTSILAAANPVESQWNKNRTIIENIQLPHTLLSRFDLIFLMLDPQDELYDKRLARHLVSLYYKTQEEEEEELLDIRLLKDFIGYSRSYISPHLTEEASQLLIQAYVDMRKIGSGKGRVSAYPRQLESLIRLSEAHAKIRFSNIVELVDVEEAKRLHREALKQSATDPVSGKIDVSILTTGLSHSARRKRQEVSQAIKKMLLAKGKIHSFNYQKIFIEFKEQSDTMVSREIFEDALKELQDDEFLIVIGRTTIRLTS